MNWTALSLSIGLAIAFGVVGYLIGGELIWAIPFAFMGLLIGWPTGAQLSRKRSGAARPSEDTAPGA